MNEFIINILSKAGVPVKFREFAGDSEIYITFFNYHETENFFADDKCVMSKYYFQIDIWSKSKNYFAILKKVKKIMKDNEFKLDVTGPELYETDTGIYHKPLRYEYCEYNEED